MISVGVVGGTGYTGVELLRLLAIHPQVELKVITSRAETGRLVAELFPSLRGVVDLAFVAPDNAGLHDLDVVFFATPNGTAMKQVPALLEAGVRVIDLAADFRLRDAAVWSDWYGMDHACPDILEQAVYGLPEVNRDVIRDAQLVANPGCYPTAVQLGFLPLLEAELIDAASLVADVKSGVSGAGRGANVATLHAEVSENFRAYAAAGHRHLPEIEQGLNTAASADVSLTFVPHLLPIIRGIHATLYATCTESADIQSLFEERYADEPFVDVLPQGMFPETKHVRGSNRCSIAVLQPQQRNRIVVLSTIDNLVKGAAGQALQNMNLMFGLPETTGLDLVPLAP